MREDEKNKGRQRGGERGTEPGQQTRGNKQMREETDGEKKKKTMRNRTFLRKRCRKKKKIMIGAKVKVLRLTRMAEGGGGQSGQQGLVRELLSRAVFGVRSVQYKSQGRSW